MVVRDLREWRSAASEEELADYETDLLAGFVLARAPGTGLVASLVCPYLQYVARGPGVRWRAVRVARDPHVAGMPGCYGRRSTTSMRWPV